MERIINYSYRGLLKSCNYTCDYCPFSKTTCTQADIQADRKALVRFYEYIAGLTASPRSLQILLLPYGEGMIHRHYAEVISRLSSLPSVRRVSCQTNLSWNVEQFVSTVQASEGDLSRISFWCSFHPQCTDLSHFTAQCNKLTQNGITYCAGMVARPGCESLASSLRESLPLRTYMWLNRMDGLRRPYTPSEVERLNRLDPFFELSLQSPQADPQACRGNVDSIHVQADGRTAPCPIARKFSSNLYTDRQTKSGKHCNASRCDCYLAYSNRMDSPLVNFFGQGRFLRIPERTALSHIFLDIDSTLTGPDGQLLPGTTEALSQLATTARLYFATEMPYLYAHRKCSALFSLFSGGIFAGGAHIRLFRPEQNHYFYLPENVLSLIRELLTAFAISPRVVRFYRTTAGVYRIAITGHVPQDLFCRLAEIKGISVQQADGLLTVISDETDKGKAVDYLLRQSGQGADATLAVGDGVPDIAMFSAVKYSVAVPGSPRQVCRAAQIVMPVRLLPVFFGR